MKFSIIIPVYNSEEFLPGCLDSIVSQNKIDYELILVDDGSSDGSLAICNKYAQQYSQITVLYQENQGPSAARNTGLDRAIGDYILFVDSDDQVFPDYLSTIQSEAEQSNADIIFFGTAHCDGVNNVDKAFPSGLFQGKTEIIPFIANNYYAGDICSCANKAFSRKLFFECELRFPVGTVVEEDLLFVLDALERADNLLSIQKVLYRYDRRPSGSVTTKYNPHKFDCKVRAYQAEIAMAQHWSSQRLEQIFNENFLSYISSCINNLMYTSCPLNKREKFQEIKRFYNAAETQYCVQISSPMSMRSRIMKMLITKKMYRVSYCMHSIIFRLMGR